MLWSLISVLYLSGQWKYAQAVAGGPTNADGADASSGTANADGADASSGTAFVCGMLVAVLAVIAFVYDLNVRHRKRKRAATSAHDVDEELGGATGQSNVGEDERKPSASPRTSPLSEEEFKQAQDEAIADLEELMEKHPILKETCEYWIWLIREQFHYALEIFPIFICILRCAVPQGRGHHDLSLFQYTESEDGIDSFLNCLTVKLLKLVSEALPTPPADFHYCHNHLELNCAGHNAPRACCPVPTPPEGELYGPCPAHSVAECHRSADVLDIVLPFLDRIRFPSMVIGFPGAGEKIMDKMYSRLSLRSDTLAVLGRIIDHLANAGTFRKGYKTPENQQEVISWEWSMLSDEIATFLASHDIEMTKDLFELGCECTVAKFVQPLNGEQKNRKMLLMKQPTLELAENVQKLLDQPEPDFPAAAALFGYASGRTRGTVGAARSLSQQHRKVQDLVDAHLLSADHAKEIKRLQVQSPKPAPTHLLRDPLLKQSTRDLAAEVQKLLVLPQPNYKAAAALFKTRAGRKAGTVGGARPPNEQHQKLWELSDAGLLAPVHFNPLKCELPKCLDTCDGERAEELRNAIFLEDAIPGSNALRETVVQIFPKKVAQQQNCLSRLEEKGLLNSDEVVRVGEQLTQTIESKRQAGMDANLEDNPDLNEDF